MASFKATAAIKHEGSKGAAREGVLLDFLRSRVPATVRAVGSSEVIDSTGRTSSQQDILLVDPSTPPFLHQGHQRMYPAECIHGVIEVKGRLTKREVFDACSKIASVKRLRKAAYRPDLLGRSYRSTIDDSMMSHLPTLGFVFAFSSQAKLPTIASNVAEWSDDKPPDEWPDALFVLDKGTVCWMRDGGASTRVRRGSNLGGLQSARADQVLLTFVVSLYDMFANAWMPPLDISAYLPEIPFGLAGELKGFPDWEAIAPLSPPTPG